MRNSSKRRIGALSLAALLALVFSFASPSLAGAKGGEKADRGDRPSVSGSTDDDSAPDTDPVDADADNAHPSGKDRHEDKGTQGKSTSDPDDDGRGPDRGTDGPDKPFVSGDGDGGVDQEDQDGNNGCGNDDDFEDDNEGWCGKPKATSTPPQDDGEVKCPKRNEMGDANANGPKDCAEKPECPETMAGGATSDDDDCDEPEVGGEVVTECPKKGETLPGGESMPDGCTTTTPTGTVTTDIAPGAVLASELQNAPGSATDAVDGSRVLGVQLERTAPAAGAAPASTSVLGAALARTGLGFTVMALALALGLLTVGFALKRGARTESDF